MKLLSTVLFAGLLSVTACSHHSKSCCQKEVQTCTKEKCDKPGCEKEKKCSDGSCEKEKEDCKDGSCKKK